MNFKVKKNISYLLNTNILYYKNLKSYNLLKNKIIFKLLKNDILFILQSLKNKKKKYFDLFEELKLKKNVVLDKKQSIDIELTKKFNESLKKYKKKILMLEKNILYNKNIIDEIRNFINKNIKKNIKLNKTIKKNLEVNKIIYKSIKSN